MIEKITEKNRKEAGEAYSTAWKSSHINIVTPAELEAHSPEERAEYLLAQMKEPGTEEYCYTYSGEVAGIIILNTAANRICSLYVIPEYWGKGVAKELIAHGIHRLNTENPINLTVLNVNMRARRFYEKCGFEYDQTGGVFSEDKSIRELIYAYNGTPL